MMGEAAVKKQADAGPWATGKYRSSSSSIHVMLKEDLAGLRELH